MLAVMPPLHNPSASDVENSRGEYKTEVFEESSSHSYTDGDEESNDNAKNDATANYTPGAGVVQQDIFVTKATHQNPLDMDDGRTLYFGRPDLGAIVEDVRDEAARLGVTHVAVFVCGPKKLVDSLKEICRNESQQLLELRGVTFDIHEEIFDF